jgi:hypothetical protein
MSILYKKGGRKMKSMKGSIRIISVLSVLTILGVLPPVITNAAVSPASVEFGEVEVGSSSTRTLRITNTNNVAIDVTFSIVGDECGFSVNVRSLFLEANGRGLVEVSYAPYEANSCSANLIVEMTRARSLEMVPLTGIGIVPSPPLPTTIMVGGVDTGIIDALYEDQLISEQIRQCEGEAKNHGQFVSCVAHLANELTREGLITKEDRTLLQRCAARARIPR